MKRSLRSACLSVCSLIFIALAATRGDAAESPPPRKLRVAITSLSASMTVPWLARESGIKEPELVRRYVTAQVEAIARMKRDRPFTLNVMSKFLRTTDNEQLSEAYEIYANNHLAKVPLPTVEAMRAVLEELESRNPKAKGQDLRKYFDDRFVRELQASGFIDGLYR
jgi:hypothetical protein